MWSPFLARSDSEPVAETKGATGNPGRPALSAAPGRPRRDGRFRLAVPDLLDPASHGTVDLRFHLIDRHSLDFGDFADDEVLGLVEHASFAVGKVFLKGEVTETLEHPRHLGDRTGPHLVGVLLEATLPVVIKGDLGVLEDVEDLFDLLLGHDPAQADVGGVAPRHHHCAVVGDYPKGEKLFHSVTGGPLLDLLDDTQAVVRINHLVADLEFLDFQSPPPTTPSTNGAPSDNVVQIVAKIAP